MSTTMSILENNLIVNDVINIGNDRNFAILELAETIIRITKSKSTIEYLPPLKEGDMTRRQPDSTKMKKILNRDFVSLEDGIQRILQSEMIFLK